MKKIGLLASICLFTLLMGGCAKNVDSTLTEGSSGTVSEIPEVQNDTPESAEQDTGVSAQDTEIPEQNAELFGQDAEIPEQDAELSEQDIELINMGIHDNEHNVYTGKIGNKEIRMKITRTEDSLSAAYITRDGEEMAFQGNLKKDVAGFILNTDSGDYLDGTISSDDNGGISISGEGVISEKDVVFTLRQDTFFPIGEDAENYYSLLGYNADAAEQFAQQIKDSINDKAAFVKLISYPISIEIDGSSISAANEEEMLGVYDQLIEKNGFRRQVENIYTKYMFANYMGICVENGIIWFSVDSSGDYKVYAINVPDNNSEIKYIVKAVADAYFAADTDMMQQYLVNPYKWTIDVYNNPDRADEISILEVKGIPDNLAGNIGDECVVSLEFKNPGEDSFTYLTIELIKDEGSWKVKYYGLEK